MRSFLFLTVLLLLTGLFAATCKDGYEDYEDGMYRGEDAEDAETYMDDSYEEAEHDAYLDDELFSQSHQEPIDGTYVVEACSNNSGNCYELDADVSDGEVETLYFPNGGHLDFDGAEIDEDGYATGDSYTWDEGYNDDSWDVTVYDWNE